MWQPPLIEHLEKKFGDQVQKLRNYATPASPGMLVERPGEDIPKLSPEMQTEFRSGIGMLLYLVKHSRPDIANVTRELAKVMDGATMKHYKDMLRVIKFVIDTKNWKLKFAPEMDFDSEWKIVAYCDSDFAGDKQTRVSVTGYVIFVCGVPIAWKSKGQRSVTLSSTEAEYVALSELCCEILFIKQVLEFMGKKISYPIQVNVDNAGAVFMANNQSTSQRTKHIDTRFHFVREYVEDGTVKVQFVKTDENLADPFTKNLGENLFVKHFANYVEKDG